MTLRASRSWAHWHPIRSLLAEGWRDGRAGRTTLALPLAEELQGLSEWRPDNVVFVLLGIGSHINHQPTFEAGRELTTAGLRVFAYDDCPYAIHTPAGLPARLAQVGDAIGESLLVRIEATLDQCLAAIACYASQAR